MKFLTFLIFIVSGFGIFSDEDQSIYSTTEGNVTFISEAPLEIIDAKSEKLKGVIDISKNTFAFSVAVNSFTGFNNELQKQHFNENYLESSRYPDAKYKGKIIEHINYSENGNYKVRSKGILDLHGESKERIIRCNINVNNGVITIISEFEIELTDHNIKVPKIVNQKIASVISVNVNAILTHE